MTGNRNRKLAAGGVAPSPTTFAMDEFCESLSKSWPNVTEDDMNADSCFESRVRGSLNDEAKVKVLRHQMHHIVALVICGASCVCESQWLYQCFFFFFWSTRFWLLGTEQKALSVNLWTEHDNSRGDYLHVKLLLASITDHYIISIQFVMAWQPMPFLLLFSSSFIILYIFGLFATPPADHDSAEHDYEHEYEDCPFVLCALHNQIWHFICSAERKH